MPTHISERVARRRPYGLSNRLGSGRSKIIGLAWLHSPSLQPAGRLATGSKLPLSRNATDHGLIVTATDGFI